MNKNKPLDYLLIPTGWKRQRKRRTIKELRSREVKNILILNGNDSEEDILYLGKILKGEERIGFVTFPLHYQEYLEIIRKAKNQKKFPENVKTENVKTRETFKQFIYGILGLLDEKINHSKIEYVKKRRENYFISKLKKVIKKILR